MCLACRRRLWNEGPFDALCACDERTIDRLQTGEAIGRLDNHCAQVHHSDLGCRGQHSGRPARGMLVAGGEWRERIRRITANPVALSVLLLFGMLAAGAFWGMGSLEERMLAVKKYADLLLIPLLISMAITIQERRRAIFTLAVSLVLTLALSLAFSAGFLPGGWLINCDPSNPCAISKPITFGQTPCIFKNTRPTTYSWHSVCCSGLLAWKSRVMGAMGAGRGLAWRGQCLIDGARPNGVVWCWPGL